MHTYGTDLMQRRTRTRVLGHHSPSARTPSSVSFNGLELGQLKMILRALIVIDYKCPPIGT